MKRDGNGERERGEAPLSYSSLSSSWIWSRGEAPDGNGEREERGGNGERDGICKRKRERKRGGRLYFIFFFIYILIRKLLNLIKKKKTENSKGNFVILKMFKMFWTKVATF